ncbi:hypothetical protein B0I72DRAFT_144621 [Yarrowia lipolytica]|uniref:YALI0B06490p n=2 Tax=Yarrowia lipolytica TaxID=4952 RepID=Q6CFJ3_YARLI|nr:YALI0B06490p [Yarrowia lipolytica CLIB122]RDW24572.1 hypothetical protein B0I71DRAFT_141869 [Yarrowia lipolytica]RDW34816.1 hypothetical protein B0I72DRAFT_144621 [Yarrowia lipolytica]RDW38582.1 hypothetical protein B0I73DRAFT_148118 [Yarrowia lipolytica]RDW46647.1 hypothetical protein B0I74DRAFT_81681 [Yarrowia lipolytica]RDW52991.1 hypothetical protein B0I75DRAFT_145774 [Yarrowia lipolytica]|eukprot:XP_500569.1 YALI0B06490p [Yarrowia lipolytica CLIB122]
MDTTRARDIKDPELLNQVGEDWKVLFFACNAFLEDYKFYCKTLKKLLKTMKPKLPVPAYRQDCLLAMEMLQSTFLEALEFIQPTKDNMYRSLERYHDDIEEFSLQVRIDYATKAYGAVSRDLSIIIDAMFERMNILEKKQEQLTRIWDDINGSFVQTCLHEMMAGQEEELKEWWYDTVLSTYGEHIKVTHKTNLGVQLDPAVSRPPLKRHIPSEIVSFIYSFADVETCVALREVNTQWYSIFQHLDSFLKSKMNNRNPWMVPGDGDLKTWQDVALVFVRRLESEKWVEKDRIDNVEATSNGRPKKTVVGKKLKFGKKLPPTFTSMTDSSACESLVCEHMHILSGPAGDEFLMDPWTLQSRQHPEEYEFVSQNSEETVIKLQGVEITIPSFVFRQRIILDISFHLGRSTVYVHLHGGGCLIMSRDKPHYGHALTILEPYSAYDAGDVSVSKQTDGYHLANIANQSLVKYTSSTSAAPVACYNGIVWLNLREMKCLVPTFIDLSTPGKVYYRADRIITDTELMENRCSQGSKSRDAAQFLVGMTARGLDVVDLVEGTVTAVSRHYGKPDQALCFVGFNQGQFQAWCMHHKDSHLTRERILAENGVEDDHED